MVNPGIQRTVAAVDATVVAELVYALPGGTPRARAVTPLVDDGEISIALPYADREFADTLARADRAALVLSDRRMALLGWEPLAIYGRFAVEPDPEGHRFVERLLDQELRKHPPSRLLADSLRDRRDHWWFLPRLLCRLGVGDVRRVAPRCESTTGVLAWSRGDRLEVDTVEVTDADDERLRLRSLADRDVHGGGSPALLFRHDYSRPDLERRSQRQEYGVLRDGVLYGSDRRGELLLPGPPGLLERIRRQRELSRACRWELARSR